MNLPRDATPPRALSGEDDEALRGAWPSGAHTWSTLS